MTDRHNHLVFAYGSNLDFGQIRERCPRAGYLCDATLPGHALAFTGWSAYRQGGVATVQPRPGATVPGVLYALDAVDLARLDGYEGVPSCYKREAVQVATDDGDVVAWTYVKTGPALATPPGPDYLATIWGAYELADWPRDRLALAAAEAGMRWTVVFVYGSLLQGFGNHGLLARGGALFVGESKTGRGLGLWSCGSFPAMRPARGAAPVRGEVYVVDDDCLAALDRLEGHPRHYRRERVILAGGLLAQTYIYQPPVDGLRRVASGDWRMDRDAR
jgi:gamma-glutamylcyclotransferase (GGCT)/AIG2-like uncharacterized protein YtfP